MKKTPFYIIILLLCTQPTISAQTLFLDAGFDPLGFQNIRIEDNGRNLSAKSFGIYPTASIKVGFALRECIFGVYGSLKVDARAFETITPPLLGYQLVKYKYDMEDAYTTADVKHTMYRVLPGFGLKYIPFFNSDCSPILQTGVDFDCFHKYKGFFEDEKGQLGKGVNTTFGAGLRFDSYFSVILELEILNHNLFNPDFSLNNGYYYPFKNMSSKMYNIMFSISWEFLN